MSSVNLDKFVEDATRTESIPDVVMVDHELLEGVMALSICVGEMMDKLKKNIFYGKHFTIEEFNSLSRDATNANELIHEVTMKSKLNKRELAVDPRVLHSIMGIFTESSELIEALDVHLFEETALDAVNLKEEFGDLLWYQAIGVDATKMDYADVFNTVIAKLKTRYPDKFTSDHAINRDLVKERNVLEKKGKK